MAVLFTGPNALMNWPDAIQIPIYIVAPIWGGVEIFAWTPFSLLTSDQNKKNIFISLAQYFTFALKLGHILEYSIAILPRILLLLACINLIHFLTQSQRIGIF